MNQPEPKFTYGEATSQSAAFGAQANLVTNPFPRKIYGQMH